MNPSQKQTAILFQALATAGLAETLGTPSNPEIMHMAQETGVSGSYPNDDTAWCGLAMGAWVTRAGLKPPPGFLSARNWLHFGDAVTVPEVGDTVVFWRDSPTSGLGHVAIFLKERSGWLYVLGGNQGNQVCIAPYLKSRVLGYRRIT